MTPFGIGKPLVEDAILNPDGKRVSDYNSVRALFIIKRLSDQYYLLVCGKWANGVLFIELGFRLHPDFVSEVRTLDPLIVFQHFVQRFGLPIRVGGEIKKLWMSESILLQSSHDPTRLFEIINPTRSGIVQCMVFGIRVIGNTRIAECGLVFCINKDEYKSWLYNSAKSLKSGSTLVSNSMRPDDFFRLQKQVLEQYFGKEWFLKQNNSSHPAYKRWLLCNKMIEQNGVILFPNQKEDLPMIGRSALDCSVLVRITKGNLDDVKLGSLSFYGDETVQTKVRSRISDPSSFEDLMVEFYTAAWYMHENYAITPLEIDKYPDFRVNLVDKEFYVECKHLTTKSDNRINEVIKKANNQVRNTGEESIGILVLDISKVIGFKKAEDDSLHEELREIMSSIQSALRGDKNRALVGAAVVWDDYLQAGEPPSETSIAARRRQSIVLHDKAPPIQHVKFFQGQSVLFKTRWGN